MFSDRLFSCRDGSTLYHAAVAFCGPTAWDTGGKFWPMFCDYICTLSSLHRFWAPARYWSKTAFSCWCAFGAPTPLLRVPLHLYVRTHRRTDNPKTYCLRPQLQNGQIRIINHELTSPKVAHQFPPQMLKAASNRATIGLTHGFPGLFTDTSEHIRFYSVVFLLCCLPILHCFCFML